MYRVGGGAILRHGVSLGVDYVAVELYLLFSCAKRNSSCTYFPAPWIKFYRHRTQTRLTPVCRHRITCFGDSSRKCSNYAMSSEEAVSLICLG